MSQACRPQFHPNVIALIDQLVEVADEWGGGCPGGSGNELPQVTYAQGLEAKKFVSVVRFPPETNHGNEPRPAAIKEQSAANPEELLAVLAEFESDARSD